MYLPEAKVPWTAGERNANSASEEYTDEVFMQWLGDKSVPSSRLRFGALAAGCTGLAKV